AETVDLDAEFVTDRGAHPLGDGARLCRVIIDVRVISQILDGFFGCIAHAATSGLARAQSSGCPIVAQTGALAHAGAAVRPPGRKAGRVPPARSRRGRPRAPPI